ncbi:MAG: glycosyl hydrolase 115 family protein [Propionibacteriaceae bacterium]|jgi:hypothetical protein|nr:glycosyl hydrolase 115 family protein [Propionibacteriaceae bacterium]
MSNTITPDPVVCLAEAGRPVLVAVAVTEPPAVLRAAAALAHDLERVCRCLATVYHSRGEARVVIGTLGSSPLIDEAIRSGVVDPAPIFDETGRPRWEGFLQRAADDALYIIGADRRGTVFGVYDFCEAIGVSPWYWWADVPVARRDRIAVESGFTHSDWPSIRYRGVFVNDEEELDAWAGAATAEGMIGPGAYERLFELILRLKGNYIWPAMHANAFNANPANGRLAQEMGLVVGASHCDILTRSNQHEWAPWLATRGLDPAAVPYDYTLAASRRLMLEYWRGAVAQNRDCEVTWTVGLRGIHDSGLLSAAIDADTTVSGQAREAAKVALLGQAVRDQRALLAETLGRPAEMVPQVFVPYKEVLALYDAGLDLPDDITIVWTDDNFGYVRRTPSATELARPGGHGLYYHSSYWSPPSRSYLATSSAPLALMRHQLSRAWAGGVETLWVDNIGGLKPLELETEFFLRAAWEAGRETTTADAWDFIATWTDRTFSGGIGARVADLLTEWGRLNQQRKVEHLTEEAFPQNGYGDEAGRRLTALRRCHDEATALWQGLPSAERDAFLELVVVKVQLTYLVNAEFYHADRSRLAYAIGDLHQADATADLSLAFGRQWRALVHYYNEVVAKGKWRHIFTPEDFPPPVMALHPAAQPTPPWTVADTTLAAASPEGGTAPQVCLDPSRPDARAGTAASRWVILAGLGRDGDAALEAQGGVGAVADFRFEWSWPGAPRLEIHRLPTLDSTGRIRIGVSVDDGPVRLVESTTTDEYEGAWERAVVDNTERLTVPLPPLAAGHHVLRLHSIDSGVVVQKLVLALGPLRPSNLGPPFDHAPARPAAVAAQELTPARLAAAARKLYGLDPNLLPLPPVRYAGPDYWAGETTFKPALAVPQTILGPPPDGRSELGRAPAGETAGAIAIEAESALAGGPGAWATAAADGTSWTHLRAPTDGGAGLAVWTTPGRCWDDPATAPSLHYQIEAAGGTYRIWALVKFNSDADASLALAVDGHHQPPTAQFCGGNLFRFPLAQIWLWVAVSDLDLEPGLHRLSLIARSGGLRVDRLYLTTGQELPPADAAWPRPSA